MENHPGIAHGQDGALGLIDGHAERAAGHPAILFGGQAMTYGELVAASRRLARVLAAQGVARGSRVCLMAHNCPEYYVMYLAVLRCGAAFFPINAQLSVEEAAYVLRNSAPALVAADGELRETMAAACAMAGIEVPGHGLARLLELAREESGRPLPLARDARDMALVIHTSGTTARPKGVVATDRMEVLSAQALHRRWAISPADISVCALPLSYTFGLFTASYVALTAGATILLLPRFHPVHVLEAIERHGATYMVGVPTMYAMMLEHVRQTGRGYDLSSMRLMAASGAPIATRTKEEFEQVFGRRLRDYYALSECTPIFSFDPGRAGESVPLGAVGSLVPGAEARIIDDAGRAVAAGETGALSVRSERLMPGYFEDPERTAAAFDGAWFKTGDLAYRDEQGWYFIVGRDRDQVISGGHKIASTEVEGLIARMEAVAGVAVVGSPDPVLGEIVKAVVVLKSGRQASAEEIIGFCQQHLAAYKVPRRIEFRQSLPISPAGKVLKRELV